MVLLCVLARLSTHGSQLQRESDRLAGLFQKHRDCLLTGLLGFESHGFVERLVYYFQDFSEECRLWRGGGGLENRTGCRGEYLGIPRDERNETGER